MSLYMCVCLCCGNVYIVDGVYIDMVLPAREFNFSLFVGKWRRP